MSLDRITVRDLFASEALHVVQDSYPDWQLKAWFGDRTGLTREEIRAKAAFMMADVMMKERGLLL